MRKNILTLLFIACALFVSSCSLEEKANGFMSTEYFYKTENDALSGLMYAYAAIPSYKNFSASYLYTLCCPTEEFTLKSDAGSGQHDLDQLRQDGLTNKETKDVFLIAYLVAGFCQTLQRTFGSPYLIAVLRLLGYPHKWALTTHLWPPLPPCNA